MKPHVTVIDYGIGNIFSICNALDHCGAEVTLSGDIQTVSSAERLVLPGVGAFKDGMAELEARSLIEPIKNHTLKNRPFLGICLGMQMMLDESEEFGTHQGLGLIPGRVIPIPDRGADGTLHKIPHIGWNNLLPPKNHKEWNSPILDTIPIGTDVYFVHSFMAVPQDDVHTLAICDYNGQHLCAVIGAGNVVGCQFHPEKSGEQGLKILTNFLRI